MSRISAEATKREGEENVSGTMNSPLEGAGKMKNKWGQMMKGPVGLETPLQFLRKGTDM